MTENAKGKKQRILVVDDAVENVRILHHALGDEHEVLFALNGEKALDTARSQSPDLILLDAVMEGMDGFGVCAESKASPQTKDIPVIFVTALDKPEDETRALEAGAVDFITKPVNVAVVRARVRTHLTLKSQRDLLVRMTVTDALTGVANRRAFDESLDKEWRRCQRSAIPLALILADIDHFKRYNDYYGHQAGDACLTSVARAIGECVRRPPDIVARYGGEEFAVVLPQETLSGAVTVAQRALDRVRALAIPHEHSSCAAIVTVSLGVSAMTPGRDLSPSALVAAADARLYEAKEAGRNRYVADVVRS